MATLDLQAHSRRAAFTARRPVVLIAEDDDELRWGLERLLEGRGYDVRSFARGDELLERIAFSLLLEDAESPDLIITDIRLPSFNGLGIVEALRRAGWNTPALVISAFIDEGLHERVQDLGAVTFFPKPLDIDRLLAAAREAVGSPGPRSE
jgi:CheY-like chemotaxis protein